MQMTIDLFDAPRARRRDPQTSKDAAAAAKELASRHHKMIMSALSHGACGKDRIATRTALDGAQVCRRLSEMERVGLIKPTGRNVKSTSGRNEREWQAC